MKNILVISASPRKGGNSDVLCDEFIKGAQQAGGEFADKADYHRLIEERSLPIMNDIDSRIVCNPKRYQGFTKTHVTTRADPYSERACGVLLKCQRDKSEYHPMPEFYFYISTHGFGYGCGYYKTDRESMDEMRAMILAGAQEYKKAYKALKDNSKFVLFGDEYKRDHFPNASREDALWLNKKDIGVSFDSEDPKLLFNVNLLDTVCSDLCFSWRCIQIFYEGGG